MNRRLTKLSLTVALVGGSLAAFASSASATFHLNLIREVHYGAGGNGDYVELQAMAAGQNLVAGKQIVSYDGGGTPLSTFTFPTNVGNGADQATILVSNGGVTGADFAATPGAGNDGTHLTVDNTGGTTCFGDSATVAVDCVAYGGNPATMYPTPPPSPYGTPFSLPGAPLAPMFPAGQSLIRTIARGCPTALDAADDTNDSAADFTLGTGNPRNNASPITETPCPTPTSTTTTKKKKCKKHKKKKTGAYSAKKHKKCKKKKKHH